MPVPLSALLNSLATLIGTPFRFAIEGLCASMAMKRACAGDLLGIDLPLVNRLFTIEGYVAPHPIGLVAVLSVETNDGHNEVDAGLHNKVRVLANAGLFQGPKDPPKTEVIGSEQCYLRHSGQLLGGNELDEAVRG